jgi:cytochrome P450
VSQAPVFNPWLPEMQADPYPYYAQLRKQAPCFYIPEGGVWAVSRYQDVKAVARDAERFTMSAGGSIRPRPELKLYPAADPPEHTQTRRMVQPRFRRGAVNAWERRAAEIASGLLDVVFDAGRVDWKADFAQPFVLKVISEMMGLPESPELSQKYLAWSQAAMDDIGLPDGDPRLSEVLGLMSEAVNFFGDLITDRSREGRNEPKDLVDLLMLDGQPIHSLREISRIALTFLAAGTQNTADGIVHLLVSMVRNPDQWALLQAEPALAPQALEEVLRHQSPAQGDYRGAAEDVELHGVTIPAQGRILLLWGSANRDDEVFDQPDRLDIRRSPAANLSFGTGAHRCLGEHIARLDGTVAARALAERVASIELADEPVTRNTSVVRGFESAPAILMPR